MIARVARWETGTRYYELYEGEELFGSPVLAQVWSGKGSHRGGGRTMVARPRVIEAMKNEAARRRHRHGYGKVPLQLR